MVEDWIAVIGPKGLPANQVKRINVSSPELAAKNFKTEMVKYADLVKKSGVVPQ